MITKGVMIMKIVFSPYWRASYAFILFIDFLMIIGTLVFCLWNRSEEDIILVMCVCGMVACSLVVMSLSRRFLVSIIVTDGEFVSYLLGRKQCTINRAEVIYYVIFREMECRFTSRKYIAISNQPFECRQTKDIGIFSWNPKPFVGSYDMKKQIVMPYDDETTVSILEIDKWIKIA